MSKPHKGPRKGVKTVAERFWAKVEKTDACWNWLGCRNNDGYGLMTYETGKVRSVHRISWEMANDSIPTGMEIDHICHNRACVNPAHLRLATRSANNQNLAGHRRDSTSGHRGVFWSKQHKMWRVRVQKDKVPYELGLFHNLEEAVMAAQAKRRELFDFNPADYAPVAV
ncbi:HNH endonuclease signature motif containing protein [Paenarthrobacter sp. CAP02]|uniref:HNH endonuclease signature motif containing protein n=1 Tax=Paenarthrobacter sp. CAP02 TaxID=3158144 RepID=UPI0032DB2D89